MKKARFPAAIQIECKYTLGDVVVLSGAVRDLHRAYPGVFQTSVATSAPDVWKFNPLISERNPAAQVISCDAIEIDRSGRTGRHYLHAYLELINRQLGTCAQITELKGDIHLSAQEKKWYSEIWNLCGGEIPFWLVSSGGKFDIPIKWWDHRRYQEVVDALRGKIQFVQVGSWCDHHPKLEGAIDLRGKTSVRDLIHLTYYAQGVLCGVTSLMHLAAAVPTEHGGERAAVIVGGAREPASWEAYPSHEYISTVRSVPCACCWKSQVAGKRDACLRPVGDLPECMDLITYDEIIARIERFEKSGQIQFLRRRDQEFAAKAVRQAALENDFDRNNVNELNAPAQAEAHIQTIAPYPAGRYRGRGIVICGGGTRYFPLAWVCIRMLRKLGCALPIELWHYGPDEIDGRMNALVRPLGVKCIDAHEVRKNHPMRNPLGWELKAYALLHSSFREVLSLDADNVPIRNPEYLFESPEYLRHGAVFWPDYGELSPRRAIWRHCGIRYRKEPEFESGQFLVNKEACWRAVNLAWWYNDHSEFYYRHIHGDKDTFHMAWRKLGQEYAMIPHPIFPLEGTMCQHDFAGDRVFQHRNTPKFVLFGENPRLAGFEYEDECLAFLAELRSRWTGRINGQPKIQEKNGWRFRAQTNDEAVFQSVVMGNEYCLPERFDREDAILDVGAHIGSFSFACHQRGSRRIFGFEPHRANFRMAQWNTKDLPGIALKQAAVLDRALLVRSEAFPEVSGLFNTGGCRIHPDRAGRTKSVAINDLLREVEQVALVKLDCEGSEWPILLNGTEWDRVGAVCGEYHLYGEDFRHEFEIWKTLDPGLLFEKLRKHFPNVLIETPNHDRLGRFWASRKRRFFARAARRINVFQKSGG